MLLFPHARALKELSRVYLFMWLCYIEQTDLGGRDNIIMCRWLSSTCFCQQNISFNFLSFSLLINSQTFDSHDLAT